MRETRVPGSRFPFNPTYYKICWFIGSLVHWFIKMTNIRYCAPLERRNWTYHRRVDTEFSIIIRKPYIPLRTVRDAFTSHGSLVGIFTRQSETTESFDSFTLIFNSITCYPSPCSRLIFVIITDNLYLQERCYAHCTKPFLTLYVG